MASGTLLEFTTENFDAEVLGSDTPVLVDVWSEGCMPCKMLTPVIEKIAETYGDQLKVGKLNAGDHREIAVKYQITAVPTVLLVKGGELVKTLNGLQPEKAYTAEIDQILA